MGRGVISIVAVVLLSFGIAVEGARANPGRLDIQNYIGSPYNNQIHETIHRSEASEDYDSYDSLYDPLFSPSGISSKIVSIIPDYEFDVDSRPEDSISSVYLETSLISQSGSSIVVSGLENELRLDMPFAEEFGWDFGTKPITFQQYDPIDPNACYPIYDVRKEINLNGGVISLPDLNGTYNSEEVYAWFQLRFDRYFTSLDGDQKTGPEDLGIFSGAWLRAVSQDDRENPDDEGAYADYNLDGTVDGADFGIFASNWLYDPNNPTTW